MLPISSNSKTFKHALSRYDAQNLRSEPQVILLVAGLASQP